MRKIYLSITLLLGLLAGSVIHAEQPRIEPVEPSREYQIKAAMLYKIAWFVRWKKEHFTDSKSPINFCLSDPDPFGVFLEQLIDGRLSGKSKRPFSVIRLDSDSDEDNLLNGCHVLYISKDSRQSVPSRLGLLVITEEQHIITSQAHINFVTENEHVTFEVNRDNLKESQLHISSKLLKLAEVVVVRN